VKRVNQLRKQWLVIALSFLIATGCAWVFAQDPPVPRDLIQNRRSVRGDVITFCINPASLTADFNRAVALEIAKALLSKANFYDIKPFNKAQPLDYSFPLSDQELLIYLSDFCEVFTGFNLTDNTYPEWLTFSRVYAHTRFVLAVSNPSYNRLEDIPTDRAIGTRFISAADLRLVTYLQSLPESQRIKRYPFFNNQILVQKLLDGTVEGIFIWEPALKVALDGNPKATSVRTISTGSFQPPVIQFGMVLRAKDTYLRTLLDQAIDTLVKDGTIDRLMDQYGIPGKAGAVEEARQQTSNAIYVATAVVLLVVLLLVGSIRRKLRVGRRV
jgi:polar amino acid transport system substrate-binding protein